MTTTDPLQLLARTRRLTVAVTVLLAIQLFGNLYEELVTNVHTYANPRPGAVGALAPGSPLFYYLPWVPLGLLLAVVLVIRLHRMAPAQVARRGRQALLCLGIGVGAKAILISSINPQFRREDISPSQIQSLSVTWGVINGIAIIAVAAAIGLLLTWRPRLLASAEPPARTTGSTFATTSSSRT